MKNILITGISELTVWRTPSNYEGGIKAAQTNEACCKFLINKLGKIDNVICLNTKETLDEKITDPSGKSTYSSYSFFCKMITDFCTDKSSVPSFHNITMSKDDVNKSNFESSLKSVAATIISLGKPEDVMLYLDVAGGLRNISILLQQLTKLLGYYGYSAEAYYTSYNIKDPTQNRFNSCRNAYEQLDILDAVNEFITKGSSRQLKAIFGKVDNNEVQNLLSAIERFSDAIQLCRVDDLSEILSDMKRAIEDFEKTDKSKDNLFMLELMIPLIQSKFNLADSEHNILNIILWCIDNGYLQQALTIYTEKIPEYIFKSGMISVSEEILETAKAEVRSSTVKSDPYAVLFYEKILNQKKEKLFASAAQQCFFQNGKISPANRSAIKNLTHHKTQIMMRVLANMQNIDKQHKIYRPWEFKPDYQPNHNSPEYQEVQSFVDDFIASNSFSDFARMMNSMINNGRINDYLQDNNKDNNDETNISDSILVQKCNNANQLTISSVSEAFQINISEDDLKTLLWDYIYIKVVRNKTNHAITSKIIPDTVQPYYQNCGYNTEDISFDGLTSNIRLIINRLRNVRRGNPCLR